MTFWQLLERQAETRADSVAIVYGKQRFTYADYLKEAERVARALAGSGIKAGDRVAVYMDNCPEQAFCYLACFRLGAIAVPLNPRYEAAEATYAIEHSGARLVIASHYHYRFVRKLAHEGRLLDHCIVLGRIDWGKHSFRHWLKHAPVDLGAPSADENLPALMLYTSGSTAKPKGVVHSQQTLINLLKNYMAWIPGDSASINITYLRAAHAGALFQQLLYSILCGGTMVLLTERRPMAFLKALEEHGGTHTILLPANLVDILEHPYARKADWSTLKYCAAGGDKVPHDIHRTFQEITQHEIYEFCGMTENGGWCMNPPHGMIKVGSIGLPLPNNEMKIVDEHGKEILDGSIGEMIVRNDSTMLYYWKNPEVTAETIRDGWLYSGDLGRRDEDGYYWFEGRRKHIIIRGGSNISPQEVENALVAHPAVEYACAVGVPDERLGERVMAYVILHKQERDKHSEGELLHFAGEQLSGYKIPERLVFREALPTNATGKLNRIQLKADASKLDLDSHELDS